MWGNVRLRNWGRTHVLILTSSLFGAGIALAREPGIHAGQPHPESTVWTVLFGTLAAILILSGVVLRLKVTQRRLRHTHDSHAKFVSAALNNLGQGVVIFDASGTLVYRNNRYLEIYHLAEHELWPEITSQELLQLRARHGCAPKESSAIENYFELAARPEGLMQQLADGRWILAKYRKLPDGGSVGTHDDCTEQCRLMEQAATAKTFLESVIDNIPVCVAAKSLDDKRYVLVNPAFEKFCGLSRDDIIGHTTEEIFHSSTIDVVEDAEAVTIHSETTQMPIEYSIRRGGTDLRRILGSQVLVNGENDGQRYIVGMFEDMTDRYKLSTELEATKRFLELVVEHMPIGIVVRQVSDNQPILVNRAASHLIGIQDQHDPAQEAFLRDAQIRDERAIQEGGLHTEEHPVRMHDGIRYFLTRRIAIAGNDGQAQYLIKTCEDITDRRETELRMAHMAHHDSLTDLPNRFAFIQALSQMIDACASTSRQFCVLSVDLDRLKEINDVFGHAFGDRLLVEVGHRLASVAAEGILARLSGGEFGIIVGEEQPGNGRELASRLGDAIREEFIIDGKSARISITTGIAVYPTDGTDATSLLANADVALFRAKAKSRGSIGLFEAQADQLIRDRRALHQDLANAVRDNELNLHLQPQCRIVGTGEGHEIVGFEVLARWTHPVRGIVPPSEFIPLAEESGLIVELGEWVLRAACREAASWSRPLRIAVNLSPAQFLHGDLVGLVHSILLETGLAPARLELEITEGVLIEDFDRGLSLLRRLKSLGVRIAMDDFGSGYSSLTYLQAFPFDKIKIDRAFVMNLGRNPQSAAIVRAVVGLGRGLGIPVIAEGVETREQFIFLAEEGCDLVQGYFLGKPAPAIQYAQLVDGSPPESENRLIA